MNFTLAELTRIKLEPGEVLVVKLYGDDYDDTDTAEFQKHLQTIFPSNVVQMIVLPVGKDLQMEVISGKLENTESKKTTETKQDLVDQLNAMNCSTGAYCSNCNCGKKAMAEANNEITESKS